LKWLALGIKSAERVANMVLQLAQNRFVNPAKLLHLIVPQFLCPMTAKLEIASGNPLRGLEIEAEYAD
jgi:hypothetical protein